MHAFISEAEKQKYPRQTLWLGIQNCILSVLISLKKKEVIEEDEYRKCEAYIGKIKNQRHLSGIEHEFLEFSLMTADCIKKKRDSSGHTIAVEALDYIEKNYMKPEVSLNTVCDALNLSVSYFSMVFKTSTNETFVEVLTRTRLEKAKEFMTLTNAKTYEIAMKVGYNDPHYFSSIFKRYTGMTPTEYVKKHRL